MNNHPIKSIFNLINTNNGEFKSKKQKEFLQSISPIVWTGQIYNSSYSYLAFLDDSGVTEVIKRTSKGEECYWNREGTGAKTINDNLKDFLDNHFELNVLRAECDKLSKEQEEALKRSDRLFVLYEEKLAQLNDAQGDSSPNNPTIVKLKEEINRLSEERKELSHYRIYVLGRAASEAQEERDKLHRKLIREFKKSQKSK